MRTLLILVLLSALFSVALAEDFKIGQPCGTPSADEYVPGEIIVKFKDGGIRQSQNQALADLGTSVISTIEQIGVHQLRIPADRSVEEMVDLYRARPDVEYAEPNYIAHAFMTPNDPYYGYQWHMPLINMPAAWDQSSGSGVVVAVNDCGVAYENYGEFAQAPDLAGTTFVPGWDFINNDAHPNDDCAHGTHVAGTIAQTTNNGLGVAGVAYNCSIMPVKVLDASGSGSYTAITNGIIWAADNGADVINMSLGAPYASTELQDALIYATNLGVTIVAAAGNAGSSTPQYPAAYPQCISVSAVRYDKTYTGYTSYGSTIDICAPGGDVGVDQNADGYPDGVLQQTHDGSNYTTFSYYFYEGTSMATPHVAGLAALLIAKNGGTMSPAAVRAAIQNTAEDLGTAGWDQYYGYGLIDANAALQTIATDAPPVANFSGTPTSGYAPLAVQFTDASTNAPATWAWTFGDGGTSTLQNPSHTYAAAGTYTVSLTVTNAFGSDAETKTGYIVVTNVPPQQCDDFNDGNITNWINKTGVWTATGGYMKGNSTLTTAQAISPFGSYSTATVNCDVRMNLGQKSRIARIIFGYADASNYRYVDADDINNRYTICERVSGRNYTRKTITATVNTAQWYALSVVAAADGNVTLKVGGVTLGSYKFAAVKTGLVGCGYNRSNSDFDNFCVSSAATASTATPTAAASSVPSSFELTQNYPNPFNPTTTISFTLPAAGEVTLEVFNVLGQQVAVLADGHFGAGAHSVTWNASSVSSGVYLYRLQAGEFTETRKMLLVK